MEENAHDKLRKQVARDGDGGGNSDAPLACLTPLKK